MSNNSDTLKAAIEARRAEVQAAKALVEAKEPSEAVDLEDLKEQVQNLKDFILKQQK